MTAASTNPVRRTANAGPAGVNATCYGPLDGSRPIVAAIHGAGGSAWIWQSVAAALENRASLVAIDLPGHGASAGPSLASVEEMSKLVIHVMDELAGRPVILMGHSMGGAVAIETALRAPEKLAGLALVATGARLKVAPGILEGMAADWELSCRQGLDFGFGPGAPRQLREDYLAERLKGSPESAISDFRACDRFDRMADLPSIKVPTVVFGGGKDLLTPAKYARFLAETIPGARLVLFPMAGHMIPLEEAPAVARALQEHFGKEGEDSDE